MRVFAQIAPFFMSAILLKSGWFAFISPLPLFILTLRNRPWLSALALITNLAYLSVGASTNELYVAGGLWVGIGMLFPLCIRKLGKIHQSFGISFIFLVTLLVAGLYIQAKNAHLGLIDYLHAEISTGMDHLINMPDSPVKDLVGEQGRDGLYRQLMTEIPSGLLLSIIFCLWINLLFTSQLVKGFLSKSFWAGYRNPEWLVVPTLICAGLFAFTEHAPYFIGLNGLKVFMAFYGMQGLSILAFTLNRYKILGIGRLIAFSIAIFIALPLVLALGFFDLWFDFRKKLGHS